MAYDDDLDNEGQEQGQQQRSNAEWAEMRQAKKAARDAQAHAEAKERENAFLRAGINPDDKKMAYFVKGYDGPADPEKVRAAAIEAGFLSATAPLTEQQQADLASGRRMEQAAAGATPPNDGIDAAKQQLAEAFKNGGREGAAAFMREQGIPVVREY